MSTWREGEGNGEEGRRIRGQEPGEKRAKGQERQESKEWDKQPLL
jgi:hypothetical protein